MIQRTAVSQKVPTKKKTSKTSKKNAPHRDSHRIDCRRSSCGCCAGDTAPAPFCAERARVFFRWKIFGEGNPRMLQNHGLNWENHGKSIYKQGVCCCNGDCSWVFFFSKYGQSQMPMFKVGKDISPIMAKTLHLLLRHPKDIRPLLSLASSGFVWSATKVHIKVLSSKR